MNLMDDDLVIELNKGELRYDRQTKRYITVNNIFGGINYKKDKMCVYLKTDRFYKDIYDYYHQGGYLTIFMSNITEIISLIFGIVFGVYIFIFLDWTRILQCGTNNDIKDCGDISIYVKPKMPNLFFILVLFVASLFTLCKILFFIYKHKTLLDIRHFYEHILKIKTCDLHSLTWSQIITDISVNQKINLSVDDITNIILRKENYLIAMIHKDILNVADQTYTKQLEINLEYTIFNDLENLSVDKLKRKFILYGIVNLLLSVFIFIYILLHFFVSNIDEFYSNKNILGSRKYTLYSRSKFRYFNELDHFFESRVNKSIKYANIYITQFPSPVIDVICKFICLISGAFIGFFLILSIMDESILLYVRLFDRSLIFYTGIIGAISASARSFLKSPEKSVYNPNAAMEKIVEYTHYIPRHWNGKYNTYTVRNEFLQMFPYTIILFLHDLLSVITTPILLIYFLPRKSADIVNFIKVNTVHTKNIGKICTFADFNLNNQQKDNKMRTSMTNFMENHSLGLKESFESSLPLINDDDLIL